MIHGGNVPARDKVLLLRSYQDTYAEGDEEGRWMSVLRTGR